MHTSASSMSVNGTKQTYQSCAPDSSFESILLTRPSKNVFRQHRPVADFEHDELVSATTSIRMSTFCNTARGGKDEIVTSSFVLVGNYLYPACVADMVLRARIGTHEASP
jgi:hypothetical protein